MNKKYSVDDVLLLLTSCLFINNVNVKNLNSLWLSTKFILLCHSGIRQKDNKDKGVKYT